MAWFNKTNKEKDSKTTVNEIREEDEETRLVSLIKSKYNKAYQAKGKFHELWKKCEQAYTGELFNRNLPDYRSQELSNFIFSTIETMKPIMLSNYPKTAVVPKTGDSFTKSKNVQNALDYEWRRAKMFEKLLGGAHFSFVYGTAIFGLFWNGEANHGLGDVECKMISPFNIFPDPSATNEDNAAYIIYATYKSLGELCEAYPEKAEKLKASTTSNPDENLMFGQDTTSLDSNNVLYIECYFRDYAIETEIEDELDEQGNKTGKKIKTTKRKYPKGRRVIIGGDILLYDGENPYEDGKFPFRVWRCYPRPNSFWGTGEVEHLISPQKHRTDVMNSIIENAGMMSNPVWILDKNSGVEKGSLTNRRGLVIRKNPGTDVRREQPPSIPAYVKDIVNTFDNDIEKISGVYDVMRGEKPAGITAAAAINALNEQAQGRIRLKVQIMENVIADLGSMWLSRMQQFWETVRTIRVMGSQYMPNQSDPMQQQEQMGMPEGMFKNPNAMSINGKSYSFHDVSKDDIDGDYDIEIVAGSTMQQNKAARLQQLIQLAQTMAEDGLPMVDRKTLLESSDLENVQDIISYFDAIRQQTQQNQVTASQDQANAQSQLEGVKHQNELEKIMVERSLDREDKQIDRENEKEGKIEDMVINETSSQTQHERDKEINKSTEKSKEEKPVEKEEPQTSEEEQMMEEIFSMLEQLSPEQIQALAESNPEFAKFLAVLQEQGIM